MPASTCPRTLHGDALDPALDQEAVQGRLVLDVANLLVLLDAKERRLSNVQVPLLDEFGHLPVEERQKQRANVAAVDVGIGHQDDLVIPELVDLEAAALSVMPQPSAEMSVATASGESMRSSRRSLDVQNLPAQRQNGLQNADLALLGTAPGRVTLDDVKLGDAGILL